MQIGGCIMETGGIPDDFDQTPQSPVHTDMGVIIKRELKDTSPASSSLPISTSDATTLDVIESPTEINFTWPTENITIKKEDKELVVQSPSNQLSLSPSVIQKTQNGFDANNFNAPAVKKNLKSQLKFHLESNASQQNGKRNFILQEEIYKQQNALINKCDRTSIDSTKCPEMFSVITPKKYDEQHQVPVSTSGLELIDPKSILESMPNESIKNWLQRLAQLQKQRNCGLEIASELHSPAAGQKQPNDSKRRIQSAQTNMSAPTQTINQQHKVVNYCDLPYMGEMTLDNCKPRRGRKPKKADICHLIYKNYGTIIPGNPQNDIQSVEAITPSDLDKVVDDSVTLCRSEVQNKIISSLLEKRLTLETKRNKEKEAKVKDQNRKQDEPLNLCIRDLNQLKIRLLRRHDNVYETESTSLTPEINVKSEPLSDDEVEFVKETKAKGEVDQTSPLEKEQSDVSSNGYVFWPNAGVFVHPMALQSQMLYYQKLVANNKYILPNPSPRPPSNSSSGSSTTKKLDSPTDIQEPKPKRAPSTPSTSSSSAPPTKRKRSAIFIPPIPSENQTNPATEVSICKFKFTGGAKPSLQEKKMLSVDSGGNFRYYSGTGDKSMRGYEFFPRETLQQQAASIGQSTSSNSASGVFLNTSGEKIPIPPTLAENSPGLRPHFLLSGSDPLLFNNDSQSATSPPPPPHNEMMNAAAVAAAVAARNKKRKTRKSLQREKLEQTFKEKGFLIQTQQLESAEGATYCKFRQLRKFTRYLFRSWKDYLPGNVREMQIEGGAGSGPSGSSELNNEKSDCEEDDYDMGCSSHLGPSDEISVSSDVASPLPDRTGSP